MSPKSSKIKIIATGTFKQQADNELLGQQRCCAQLWDICSRSSPPRSVRKVVFAFPSVQQSLHGNAGRAWVVSLLTEVKGKTLQCSLTVGDQRLMWKDIARGLFVSAKGYAQRVPQLHPCPAPLLLFPGVDFCSLWQVALTEISSCSLFCLTGWSVVALTQ